MSAVKSGQTMSRHIEREYRIELSKCNTNHLEQGMWRESVYISVSPVSCTRLLVQSRDLIQSVIVETLVVFWSLRVAYETS